MTRPDQYTVHKAIVGATTETETTALDWDVRDESKKLILLKNTGTANSLDFCIFSKAMFGGEIDYQDDTNTLPPLSVFKAVYDTYQAEIIVLVRDTNPGDHTTFRIEYGALIDR